MSSTNEVLLNNKNTKSIDHYKNRFKMGMCVMLANEYIEDNPSKNLHVLVFRMLQNNKSGRFFKCINFKEKFNESNINSHVVLKDNSLIIDPSFGCEQMNINDYLKFLLENNLIDYEPHQGKEIIFDFQILEDMYRKENRSQYNNDYDLCSYIINTESKKCFTRHV